MRYLYLIALAGLPRLAAAQAVAADSNATQPVAIDERWVRSQVDSVGECTEVLHMSGRGGLVRVFHPSGRLKQYLPYADLTAGLLHGVITSWYDSGQLASQQTFIQGKREGALLLYYSNGQLKRQTRYEAGNELIGTCFDMAGEPLAYFPYEQPPLYPGGQVQLMKEIKESLQRWRPTGAVQLNSLQVHISFRVNEDGGVANPQVAVSDETYRLLMLPNSPVIPGSWQAARERTVAMLVSRLQQTVSQLTKTFYPGQRDGATVSWQYSFTIPINYGAQPPATRNIRRRDTNFGP
ncbi:MAG: toxin-antitoxin system YwqK family antitoxin [Janthinobacterium lividum]